MLMVCDVNFFEMMFEVWKILWWGWRRYLVFNKKFINCCLKLSIIKIRCDLL